MRNFIRKGKASYAEALRQWRAGTSPLHTLRSWLVAVGGQLVRQHKRRTKETNQLLDMGWQYLPPYLRKRSANLYKIRTGTIGFFIFMIIYILSAASASTPMEFFGQLFSGTTALGLFGIIAAALILVLRAMQSAPDFIDAYCQMFPDHEDQIKEEYCERGLGDVITPWVKTRRPIGAVFAGIARRFFRY